MQLGFPRFQRQLVGWQSARAVPGATGSSQITLLDSLEELNRRGSRGGVPEPDVGRQERHVQFRSELDEQGVVHPEIFLGRQVGSTFQPVSGRLEIHRLNRSRAIE